ncbi:hypothetical protein C497_05682 [Halalkalicoccus jeotgali B3]|uniref:Uncharacterized protein n=1 Tax=Halalkalicoccus jeotgali (strain DSM 18796 / CECT 7217 / JCM 14584 / KCTC 4019 / B3) TaxID=795797 RepID=D8JAW7_HALJB|nr:hypothetical protein HacjB3_07270 [Halalkalicoccus jeotgali B3]ELY39422.1 hypothetical protein C497_05682 [Halalkalicoccus jeotgali B3]
MDRITIFEVGEDISPLVFRSILTHESCFFEVRIAEIVFNEYIPEFALITRRPSKFESFYRLIRPPTVVKIVASSRWTFWMIPILSVILNYFVDLVMIPFNRDSHRLFPTRTVHLLRNSFIFTVVI